MALLDKLEDKALEEINDPARQKAWVERGYDAVAGKIMDLLPADPELAANGLPLTQEQQELRSFREAVVFDLAKLERHKPTLVSLGEHGLRSTIALVGLGRYDAAAKHAALITLRTTASWSQVNEAILTDAETGNQKKRDLDAKIAELKTVLRDVGTFAATRLLPFLLTLI